MSATGCVKHWFPRVEEPSALRSGSDLVQVIFSQPTAVVRESGGVQGDTVLDALVLTGVFRSLRGDTMRLASARISDVKGRRSGPYDEVRAIITPEADLRVRRFDSGGTGVLTLFAAVGLLVLGFAMLMLWMKSQGQNIG